MHLTDNYYLTADPNQFILVEKRGNGERRHYYPSLSTLVSALAEKRVQGKVLANLGTMKAISEEMGEWAKGFKIQLTSDLREAVRRTHGNS